MQEPSAQEPQPTPAEPQPTRPVEQPAPPGAAPGPSDQDTVVAPAAPDRLVEDLPEPVFTPFSLTVGDGFKFGCGLTMALFIALLILFLFATVLYLAATLVGVPLPLGR